jgi:outer membrane protein assembly factor BamB
LGHPIHWAPTCTDRLYLATKDGFLHCLDPETGERIWKTETPGPVQRSVESTEDGIVFVTTHGHVSLLDENGMTRWTRQIAGRNPSAARAWGSLVLLGAGDPDRGSSALYALDLSLGKIRYRVDAAGWPRGRPAIRRNTAYLGTTQGVMAVDLEQGCHSWTYRTEGMLHAPPTADQERVYLVAQDGCYALQISE